MSPQNNSENVQSFEPSHPESFRIETEGGTVYWLSAPDSESTRQVIREHELSTGTMIMQPIATSSDGPDFGSKFKARLGGDLVTGLPFLLEVQDSETRILSEAIVSIEVGNVPEMVFA